MGRSSCPRGLAACLLVAVPCGGIPESEVCRNPLFEIHWFVKSGLHPPLMNEDALTRTNLRLCPAFNGRPSCCVEAFEAEQMLYFNYWNQIFTAKLEGVRELQKSVDDIQQLDIFNAASDQARDQYWQVVRALQMLSEPRNHAMCFTALQIYTAGMLCFACEAAWKTLVELDEGKVVRILLAEISCQEVWEACKSFGALTRRAALMLVDSSLAALQDSPVENMEMFHDQQALCDWMHDTVAMRPFTTPPEAQREAAPAPEFIRPTRRLDGHNVTLRRLEYGEPIAREFDSMQAGRASGFHTAWPGLQAAAAMPNTATHVLLVVCMLCLDASPI